MARQSGALVADPAWQRGTEHEEKVLYLKYDPFFGEMRSDPRYVALEKRVGPI